MYMKISIYRLLWAFLLLGLLFSCEKQPQTQKVDFPMTAEYAGQSARGLEFRLPETVFPDCIR